MASDRRTADYLAEQMAGAGEISTRAMFGEYAAYCDGKVIGLICNNQLFIKPTEAGRALLGDEVVEAPPHPVAKDYFLIAGDSCEDHEWLSALVRVTADALPPPQPKRARTRK